MLLLCGVISSAIAVETDQEYTIKVPVADDEQEELDSNSTGYFFCTVSNNKVTVIQYSGTATSITIPKKIAGLAVTTIGAGAFKNTGVKKVTISSGVKKIQKLAFANTSLTKITLPKSITSIAGTAFKGAAVKTFSAPVGSYAYNWGVSKGFVASTSYRALLIGEKTFLRYNNGEYYKETANRNEGDVNHMASMLKKVYGPAGTKYTVKSLIDQTYSQIESAIKKTFSSTTENDVSLFFIASHGDHENEGELEISYTGSLTDDEELYDYFYGNSFLSFSTLAKWLKKYVKGKVIVIIESCGAGSAIYEVSEENNPRLADPGTVTFDNTLTALEASNGGESDLIVNNPIQSQTNNYSGKTASGAEKFVSATRSSDPEAVANSAVKAFSAADTKIETDFNDFEMESSQKTGELRVANKFYVLAASRHHEMSWGGSSSNLFTDLRRCHQYRGWQALSHQVVAQLRMDESDIQLRHHQRHL